MEATLIQRSHVEDGRLIGRKLLSLGKKKTSPRKEAPANFVPAAAVIRKGQVLFKIIGRKEYVGGLLSYMLKP
jgi:hypothetical protein